MISIIIITILRLVCLSTLDSTDCVGEQSLYNCATHPMLMLKATRIMMMMMVMVMMVMVIMMMMVMMALRSSIYWAEDNVFHTLLFSITLLHSHCSYAQRFCKQHFANFQDDCNTSLEGGLNMLGQLHLVSASGSTKGNISRFFSLHQKKKFFGQCITLLWATVTAEHLKMPSFSTIAIGLLWWLFWKPIKISAPHTFCLQNTLTPTTCHWYSYVSV